MAKGFHVRSEIAERDGQRCFGVRVVERGDDDSETTLVAVTTPDGQERDRLVREFLTLLERLTGSSASIYLPPE